MCGDPPNIDLTHQLSVYPRGTYNYFVLLKWSPGTSNLTTVPLGIAIDFTSPAALLALRMVSWELILGMFGTYYCTIVRSIHIHVKS